MKRRHLILMLGGASSGALSIGTGAFSSARMERGVNVSVVDDENAFVRYETPSDEAVIEQGGEQITLVRIRNQFGGNQKIALVGVEIDADPDILTGVEAERKLTNEGNPADPEDVEPPDEGSFDPIDEVTIETGSDADDFPDPDKGEAFGPGGWARVTARANPDPGQEVDIEVTITVKGIEGTGVSARIFGDTRTFTIEGEEIDPVTSVTFRGAENADADAGGRTLSAEALFVEPGDDDDDLDLDDTRIEGPDDWDTSKKIKNSFSENPSGKLVAVRFVETGQIFVHPQYDIGDDSLPDSWDTSEGQEIEDETYQAESSGNGNDD